ncbi:MULTISPECIES: MauE/DoxX family redox-associated membrane protein [Nocardiopsis]|uniref:MauE/DoxX family redox-associated membrane protein n=1 Tax=Nocardiopsis lambiniae TaxID=3075539 RepID=A0ABU2MCS2_9ACTN|nr:MULTISPECIES: MauE/DoxX family redox-associated membrane protein [unclassified Nocardiopsis]MDE3720315.1 DoxX family protein [Nocardiopsis sp. N85]MDT0330482.1 MauE/DoxX family redox-associated membrane protein [Nocardiopsis sp. DSM 44743]
MDTTDETPALVSGSRWDTVQPWITFVCRLALAGILGYSAFSKYPPALSVQAVEAYDLFPHELARLIGYTLPLFELALAVLLLVGLATRFTGAVATLLMLVFIAGIVSAMARGLSIDCGCFGGGGAVDPEETTYGLSITRDIGFAALGAFIALWPRSPLALDRALGLFR